MVSNRKWQVGSDQYVKRPGQAVPRNPGIEAARADATSLSSVQRSECAITWDREALDYSPIAQHSVERCRHRFRALLPHLIWNAAALEGNNFTLPEVQTLLEGVTVGGRSLDDAQQILALSDGYSFVDELVGTGQFELTKSVSDEIHARIALHEAIESGHFRGEGNVTGGGTVRLANGGVAPGFPSGEGGELLLERFSRTVGYLNELRDPRERALVYFASATRQQFYFDGNKRTARLMMSGELMANGFDAISVPFARKFELNGALDELFTSDDATSFISFLISCAERE